VEPNVRVRTARYPFPPREAKVESGPEVSPHRVGTVAHLKRVENARGRRWNCAARGEAMERL